MSDEIQFIDSNPSDRAGTASRKRAHAHAARVAHAKRPRFHFVEYCAGTARTIALANRTSTPQQAYGSGTTKTTEEENVSSPKSLLSSARNDPFNSFARTFTNVEHFLLDHYTQVVIPLQSVECNRLLGPEEFRKLMLEEWTRLTVRRGDSLDSMFLAACRHLSIVQHLQPEQSQRYKQLALQYKVSCLQKLNKDFSVEVDSASTISEATIATSMMLASDELKLGDFEMCKAHLVRILKWSGVMVDRRLWAVEAS
uniref:Uncharacterized protein n=1 Tax=Talaromyces marneffei PM1 TaxID=1077442 RepID=A0A093VA32_TALMA